MKFRVLISDENLCHFIVVLSSSDNALHAIVNNWSIFSLEDQGMGFTAWPSVRIGGGWREVRRNQIEDCCQYISRSLTLSDKECD